LAPGRPVAVTSVDVIGTDVECRRRRRRRRQRLTSDHSGLAHRPVVVAGQTGLSGPGRRRRLSAAEAHLFDAPVDVADDGRTVGLPVGLQFVGQPVGQVVGHGVRRAAVHVLVADADSSGYSHLERKILSLI
jgi:hypothetical protein